MASLLTSARLQAFLPALTDPAGWTDALVPALDRFEITSRERIAAFLAQVAHESVGFTHLVEGLSYTAKRLLAVWPRRFPTLADAAPYARQPEKLANRVYGGRLGNGDAASGDGWRFRGRGLLQLTGRDNYRRCGQALGLPLEADPDQLATPPIAALTAAHYWWSHGLNALADDRSDDDDDADFVRITVLINGGRAGLDDRLALWARARRALA